MKDVGHFSRGPRPSDIADERLSIHIGKVKELKMDVLNRTLEFGDTDKIRLLQKEVLGLLHKLL